jgi:hypothetical protein
VITVLFSYATFYTLFLPLSEGIKKQKITTLILYFIQPATGKVVMPIYDRKETLAVMKNCFAFSDFQLRVQYYKNKQIKNMTVPKLKEQALEKLQQEAEKVVKERICFHRNMVLTLADHYRSERSLSEIIKKHVDKLSEENKQGFWQNLKLTLREIITDEGFITRFKEYSSTLENYFEGSQTGASPNAQQVLSNFRYYNELTINALEFFNQHLNSNELSFSADVHKQ